MLAGGWVYVAALAASFVVATAGPAAISSFNQFSLSSAGS
jgi:hypothetical protein